MGAPRELGGTQAGLADQVRVAIELGRGCTSTAWVASLSVAVKSQLGNVLSTEARSALSARPDAVLCASGIGGGPAIREPGGVRVRGPIRHRLLARRRHGVRGGARLRAGSSGTNRDASGPRRGRERVPRSAR
jgi:alkylation response protein AidB-like acyl-CoA dehydrogenase